MNALQAEIEAARERIGALDKEAYRLREEVAWLRSRLHEALTALDVTAGNIRSQMAARGSAYLNLFGAWLETVDAARLGEFVGDALYSSYVVPAGLPCGVQGCSGTTKAAQPLCDLHTESDARIKEAHAAKRGQP